MHRGERAGRGRNRDGRSYFIVLTLEACKDLLILKRKINKSCRGERTRVGVGSGAVAVLVFLVNLKSRVSFSPEPL